MSAKNDRRMLIRQHIDSNGEVSLVELQEVFPDFSLMTLRRDLIALEEEGVIRRTRGGAIALRQVTGAEGLYSHRAMENIGGKMKIARRCLPLLGFDSALFLDSGSTLMCLARLLPDSYRPILTSGVNIALELIKHPSFSVTLLGGQLNSNTLSVSGQIAEDNADIFNIETAVMATSGFSLEEGFSSGTHTENELKRSIIRKAKRVIMLMDTRKLERSMPLTFAALEDIHVLILDAEPSPQLRQACDRAEVELLIAEG